MKKIITFTIAFAMLFSPFFDILPIQASAAPIKNGTSYNITNVEDLQWVADQVNRGLKDFSGEIISIAAPIDMKGVVWTPIGSKSGHHFKGDIKGNNQTINNLYSEKGGLIGAWDVSGGRTITQLRLENINITGPSGGAIASYVIGDQTDVFNIDNVWVNGEIAVSGNRGSLVGEIAGATKFGIQASGSHISNVGMGLVFTAPSTTNIRFVNCYYNNSSAISIAGGASINDDYLYRYYPIKSIRRGVTEPAMKFYKKNGDAVDGAHIPTVTVEKVNVSDDKISISGGDITGEILGTTSYKVNFSISSHNFNSVFPLEVLPARFQISYHQDNGEPNKGTMIEIRTYNEGDTITWPTPLPSKEVNLGTEENPVFETHYFYGWGDFNKIQGSGGTYTYEEITDWESINEDMRVITIYKLNQYVVQFESNGVIVGSVEGVRNGYIAEPVAPSNVANSKFLGWYKDEKCIEPWIFHKDTVKGDTILYAKWAKVVTVSFNTNGGNDIPEKSFYEQGYLAKPANPIKENYIFLGWYKDEDLKTEFNFSTQVTEDIILYAKWMMKDIIVTFDSQGGTATKSVQLNAIEPVKRPPDPTKLKSRFQGWFTENDIEWNFGTSIEESMTLYAKWLDTSTGSSTSGRDDDDDDDVDEDEVFTISYSINGSGRLIGGDVKQEVKYGEDSEWITAKPLEGFEFEEWSDGDVNPRRRETDVKKSRNFTAYFKKIEEEIVTTAAPVNDSVYPSSGIVSMAPPSTPTGDAVLGETPSDTTTGLPDPESIDPNDNLDNLEIKDETHDLIVDTETLIPREGKISSKIISGIDITRMNSSLNPINTINTSSGNGGENTIYNPTSDTPIIVNTAGSGTTESTDNAAPIESVSGTSNQTSQNAPFPVPIPIIAGVGAVLIVGLAIFGFIKKRR